MSTRYEIAIEVIEAIGALLALISRIVIAVAVLRLMGVQI